MKNKKIRFLSALLALVFSLSICASAISPRASDYITMTNTAAKHTGSGNISILVTVEGTGRMTSLGAESIYVYEKIAGHWSLVDSFGKSDGGMTSSNTSFHSDTVKFSGYENTEYKISITLFAANASGSDTRSYEHIVNT